MNNRIYSFLGLAARAGGLSCGDKAVEYAVKMGKCKLVLVTDDASPNTVRKFTHLAESYRIPVLQFGRKDELGKYVGRGVISVIGIMNGSFSQRVIELIETWRKESGGECDEQSQNL